MTPAVSPLDGRLFGERQACFGCSPTHPAGFRLSFEVDGEAVLTRFTPTHLHQGPLGLMHGGLISTVADEAAAWAVLAGTGKFGFTTNFEAKLTRGLKINVEATARAWLTRTTSRIVRASVAITQEDAACFSGDFTFALLDRAAAEKLMGAPVPEEWVRFCR